jgi:hypothetical protein
MGRSRRPLTHCLGTDSRVAMRSWVRERGSARRDQRRVREVDEERVPSLTMLLPRVLDVLNPWPLTGGVRG